MSLPMEISINSPRTLQLVKFAFPLVSTATRTPSSSHSHCKQGRTSSYR